MLVCGIDIGTTNLKVALFDEGNQMVWSRSAATPRTRDSLGEVTDASALTAIIEQMIVAGWREVAAPHPISAISTTGVGEDGVFVDGNLEPLTYAVPWFDHRASAEAEELRDCKFVTPRTGIAFEPTRTAPKWLWSARNLAEAAGAHCWLALTDYPLAKWAGQAFMSDTLASRTGCFDPVERNWVGSLLDASEAPNLPPVVAAGFVVGPMRSLGLLQTGAVTAETLLVAGGHDHPVAAHAIHQLSPTAKVDSMGTANVVYGDAPTFEITSFDPWISFMVSLAGPKQLACLGVFEFTANVRRLPGGMDSVREALAQPQLPGTPGEGGQDRLTSVRSLLEWATLNARRMLDRLDGYGVPPGPIFATGGWSRSAALMELRASVFGQPVHVPHERELSVLGAALFAAAAVGASTEIRTPITVVDPNRTWADHYAVVFEEFLERAG